MFQCQECGKKFRTAASAQRASNNGCPKCGGCDIDLASTKKTTRTEPMVDLGHQFPDLGADQQVTYTGQPADVVGGQRVTERHYLRHASNGYSLCYNVYGQTVVINRLFDGVLDQTFTLGRQQARDHWLVRRNNGFSVCSVEEAVACRRVPPVEVGV